MVPIVVRPTVASSEKHAVAEVVLKQMPISGPFRFHAEQTMNRPHISWNFSQAADCWTVATTQPAYLPNGQTVSVPDELPAGDWCTFGLANFSGLGHYQTDVTLDPVSTGTRVILDLGKVAVSAEVKINGISAGIVFIDPYRLDITDFVNAGANRLEIVVANTLANYYSQFKELDDAKKPVGGTKSEEKLSGLIGPVQLLVVKGGSYLTIKP
jgi:hypothetical protein